MYRLTVVMPGRGQVSQLSLSLGCAESSLRNQELFLSDEKRDQIWKSFTKFEARLRDARRKNSHAAQKSGRSPIRSGLEGFHVGDYVFDLHGVEHIFKRRHQRVAIFNPGL